MTLLLGCSRLSLKAASFQTDALFQFTSSVGALPSPAADVSALGLDISALPNSNPPSQLLETFGVPVVGESNLLSNSFNSAQYSVTNISSALFSPTQFGFSADGSFSDPSQINSGFGPMSFSIMEYDTFDGLAGTLSTNFSCNLVVGGAGQRSNCFVISALYGTGPVNSTSSTTVFTQEVIADLRGTGQATWDGSQIVASGSDYQLCLGYVALSNVAGGGADNCIQVQGGIVTSAVNLDLPFILPQVGSSGNFTMSAPVLPVSYDYRSTLGSYTNQQLIFETVESAGFTAPEAASMRVTFLGLVIILLMISRSRKSFCGALDCRHFSGTANVSVSR